MKLIRRGVNNSEVKKWQVFLNAQGYNCGSADGIFGGKTETATISFQLANGLVADGIAGKLTIQAAENLGFEKQQSYTRDVNEIIVHITASNDNATVEQIRAGHLARGFSDIGYHWLIDRKGNILTGRDESIIGSHCQGHNTGTIGVAYIARGSDTQPDAPYGKFMTPEQKAGLEKCVKDLLGKYKLSPADVYGHNDYNSGKACPCFKVKRSSVFLINIKP